jgi:hypothetical protein
MTLTLKMVKAAIRQSLNGKYIEHLKEVNPEAYSELQIEIEKKVQQDKVGRFNEMIRREKWFMTWGV